MPSGGPARVFLTGATGLVGGRLAARLAADGVELVALTRRPDAVAPPLAACARFIAGDVREPGAWQAELDGADAVIHLAGAPIAAQRWTSAYKQQIRASRIEGTRLVVAAIERSARPPGVLVAASAAGYYGARGEEILGEDAPPGEDFLARLCVDWEAESQRAAAAGTRVVMLRFGMVLGTEGGALPRMLPPFQLGVGGPLGPADRFTPWIHVDDAAGLARFALRPEGASLAGPVNAVAPQPTRMGEFARTLGRVLGRPALIPVPELALRAVLGEAVSALVPGQRVEPRAAREAGYRFAHPELEGALRDLLD